VSAGAVVAQRSAASPALAPGFEGVALAPPAPGARPILHGAFRLPWPDADRIEAPRHRALVLVATSAGESLARTPFADAVLFDDDEEATRSGPLGYFSLDAVELLGQAEGGTYFVHVSLGAHISNVVRVTLG
jgi:hypothetical protein